MEPVCESILPGATLAFDKNRGVAVEYSLQRLVHTDSMGEFVEKRSG